MKILFILPAHNEEKSIEWSVDSLREWANNSYGSGNFFIIISENASTDSTLLISKKLEQKYSEVSVLVSDEPGKGGAIKRALMTMEADIYVLSDVDLSVDLGSSKKLIDEVVSGKGLVISSRRMDGSEVIRPTHRKLITFAYSLLSNSILGLGVKDTQCGFKVISKKVRDQIIPKVKDDGFFFDTELLAKAKNDGFEIIEMPVKWEERSFMGRKSTVNVFKTSIRFLGKLNKLKKELS